MSGTSLYEITKNISELEYIIENHEGEMNLEVLGDTEESLQLSLDDKLEGIMKVRQNKLSRIETFKTEEKRLSELRKTEESSIAKLEKYAVMQLQRLGYNYKGKKKRDVGIFAIQFKKLPPKLEILDETKIPMTYMNIPIPPNPTPDKKELLDFLKAEVLKNGKDIKKIDEFNYADFGIKLINNGEKIDFK